MVWLSKACRLCGYQRLVGCGFTVLGCVGIEGLYGV